MAERKIEKEKEEEISPLILKTQEYADLRQLARKNLQEAERVLAESGYQLFKNTKVDPETPNDDRKKASLERRKLKREK